MSLGKSLALLTIEIHAPRLALPVVAALTVALITAAPAAAGVRTCDGMPATIQRGDRDNDIFGTPENDVIVAGGGDDLVIASSGRDRVCGEGGNDEIAGQQGNDPLLSGGAGRDFISGDEGADKVAGAGGDDGGDTTWRGEPFRAGLEGRAGDDTVSGGAGDDGDGFNFTAPVKGLDGGSGDDELFGGVGDDDIEDATGPDSGASADVDRVFGGDGSEEMTVLDGDGLDAIDCGPGGEVFYNDPGDEITGC